MDRRKFLSLTGTFTGGLLLLPDFLHVYAQQPNLNRPTNQLVFIQLNGGNDGLNTFIPFSDPAYYELRKSIAIPKDAVFRANNSMGWHPSLKNLANIQQDGNLTVIQNVGYANPNKSHFRSREIWQTASDSNSILTEGWLGKYLDLHCTDHQPTAALNFDVSDNLALKGKDIHHSTIRNPNMIARLKTSETSSELSGNPQLDFVRKLAASTSEGSKIIQQAIAKAKDSTVSYPSNSFAGNLKWIGKLLRAEVDSSVFYTSLNGFDTHDNQLVLHRNILKTFDESIGAFYTELKQNQLLEKVTIVVFSEFGRSAKDNGSGTDHGTAAPLFIIGGDNKGKIVGANPELQKLVAGDLEYQIDFRSVYATILKERLDFNPAKIRITEKPIAGIF